MKFNDKIDAKNWSKKMIYKWRKWVVKNWPKNDQKWPFYKTLKNDPNLLKSWYATGGSKSSKIDLGGPGPQNINFLKFSTFLQKLPEIWPL
jgi:hypothetical protein